MPRTGTFERKTSETDIRVVISLDGTGQYRVQTPLPFLSHMLEQLARHSGADLEVEAKGDVEIDGHHTTEDVGFVLGCALKAALGTKQGIQRYGSATIPMDDVCVLSAVDLSGRPYLLWRVALPKAKLGEFDVELAEVFFDGFVRGSGINLYLKLLESGNLHHMVEACFKATARACRQAWAHTGDGASLPSTKGTLV